MYSKKLKENKKSAKEVTEIFRNEFAESLGNLTISEKYVDLEQGFADAKLNGSQYLMNVDINQWKDAFYQMCSPSQNSNGTISDAPTMDTVDLTVYIYDVKSKTLINKQKIENRGCPIVLLGIIPIGKNSPDSRLKDMINKEWLNNIK